MSAADVVGWIFVLCGGKDDSSRKRSEEPKAADQQHGASLVVCDGQADSLETDRPTHPLRSCTSDVGFCAHLRRRLLAPGTFDFLLDGSRVTGTELARNRNNQKAKNRALS